MPKAVDSEQIEGNPTPITVATMEELPEAIEDSEDGDTILIGATISVQENTTIGNSDKRLTLSEISRFVYLSVSLVRR